MPPQNTPIVKHADYTGSGIQAALWSPVANVTAYITDIIVASEDDVTVHLKIGATTMYTVSFTGLDTHGHSFVSPLHGDTEEAVYVDTDGAAGVGVTLCGYEQFHSA